MPETSSTNTAGAVEVGDGPVARSPIRPLPPVRLHAGWEVSGRRSEAALQLADLSPLAKVHVRTSPTSALASFLEVGFGRSARDEGGRLVVGAGPDSWTVIGRTGTASEIVASLQAAAGAEPASVIDTTHGRALVRLTGSDARRLLEKVCAIDFDDAVTPDGATFTSSVARVVTEVVRDDLDGLPSYLLACERSSGQYLFDSLLDAGNEFTVEIDGFPEKEI